jgi:hypothetical protein
MPPKSNRASLARKRWQESRVHWVAALPSPDALFRRPALFVEVDDRAVRPGQRGDDEPHSVEQLAEATAVGTE